MVHAMASRASRIRADVQRDHEEKCSHEYSQSARLDAHFHMLFVQPDRSVISENEKWPGHADSPKEKSLKKFDQRFTPNTSFITSSQFYDIMEATSPPAVQMESVRRGEPGADAVYGRGGYENVHLRVES